MDRREQARARVDGGRSAKKTKNDAVDRLDKKKTILSLRGSMLSKGTTGSAGRSEHCYMQVNSLKILPLLTSLVEDWGK